MIRLEIRMGLPCLILQQTFVARENIKAGQPVSLLRIKDGEYADVDDYDPCAVVLWASGERILGNADEDAEAETPVRVSIPFPQIFPE
jgi:hypothetical protein